MINIEVSKLSFSQCVALKMPGIFDFIVFCTDGVLDWQGACKTKDLQACIECGKRNWEIRK